MTELYPEKDRQSAASARTKSLLIYVVISVFCVAVCALFVVLYTKHEKLLFLCAAIDFVITVGLIWYSVLYFAHVFPKYTGKLRIYKVMENAVTKTLSLTFVSAKEKKVIEHVEYVYCEFESDGESIELLVAPGWENVFKAGRRYEIKVMGERVTAFCEADGRSGARKD
ncbi:MAG: hypothetical protein J1F33_02835 [Clostridiales bacterium]|nr:hypothetical protein [Clostridiales bacterium]